MATATGLTSRALRHYEQIGLLSPSRVASNGYRYYGVRELAKIYRILSLRALDLPLADDRKALDDDTDPIAAHFQALVTEHYAWVTEQWAGRHPDHQSYFGHSHLYVADPHFASYYGGNEDAEIIRTAIQHGVNVHLK